jgi:hypothetical protein
MDMQNEIGCDSGDAGAMRDPIQRPAQFGMPVDESSDIFDLPACA